MVSVFSSNSQQERKLSTFPKIQMSPSRGAQNNKLLPSQTYMYHLLYHYFNNRIPRSPQSECSSNHQNCYLCTGLLPLDRTRWAFSHLRWTKKILRPICQNFNISFWNLWYNNVHKFLLFFSSQRWPLCVSDSILSLLPDYSKITSKSIAALIQWNAGAISIAADTAEADDKLFFSLEKRNRDTCPVVISTLSAWPWWRFIIHRK